MPAVEFNVHCETTLGEKVVVVGSGDSAGLWDPQRSLIKLDTNSEIYPRWAGITDLPKGLTFEFKFAVLSASDGPARWEQICNRSLEVTDIAAKLRADFDRPNEQVELACADQIRSRTDASEDADAAPAGMMMATAPAMEATNFKIEAAKAKEAAAEELEKRAEVGVVKAAVPDKVVEAPGVAAESTQSARAAEEFPRAEEARKVEAPIENELAMRDEATVEVTDIAAKLRADFDRPNVQVELACADQIRSRTDALEDADAATGATPAFAGTAPAGMMMATAPAMEATNFEIEAAKGKEAAAEELENGAEVGVVKAAVPDKVVEAPGVAAESTQSARAAEDFPRAEEARKVDGPIENELAMGDEATEIAKVQGAPKAQEATKTRKAGKVEAAKVVEAVGVCEGIVKAVPALASSI